MEASTIFLLTFSLVWAAPEVTAQEEKATLATPLLSQLKEVMHLNRTRGSAQRKMAEAAKSLNQAKANYLMKQHAEVLRTTRRDLYKLYKLECDDVDYNRVGVLDYVLDYVRTPRPKSKCREQLAGTVDMTQVPWTTHGYLRQRARTANCGTSVACFEKHVSSGFKLNGKVVATEIMFISMAILSLALLMLYWRRRRRQQGSASRKRR